MLTGLASRLARLVVQYCVDVQHGETVAIEGSTEALPLINEVYREVLRAGCLSILGEFRLSVAHSQVTSYLPRCLNAPTTGAHIV